MSQVPGEPDIVDIDEPEEVPPEADADVPDGSKGGDRPQDEEPSLEAAMINEPDIVDLD